jgi:hypothetical protein
MTVVPKDTKRNVGLTEALGALEPGDSIWLEGVGHAAAHAILAQQQKQGNWKGRKFSQESYRAVKADWTDIVSIYRVTRTH